MKFGICYDLKKCDQAAAMGFDYIEGVVSVTAELADSEYSALKDFLTLQPIAAEAFCGLFPGGLKIVGPQFSLCDIESYLDKALPRVAALGAKVVVFGSGTSRKIPDGFDRAKAWHQLVTVGRLLGEKASANGLTIALEPLNIFETNIINTQLEGMELVAEVNHPSFQILTDFYHLALAGEGENEIAACGSTLAHAHIANPVTRSLPAEGDGVDYKAFFKGLHRAGYSGRVSFEGVIADEALLPQALAFLRKEAADTLA